MLTRSFGGRLFPTVAGADSDVAAAEDGRTPGGRISIILRSIRERNSCHARLMCAFLALGESWQRAINCCMARQPSPSRLSTFSSIACETWNREFRRSGWAAIRRRKVFLSQLTKFLSGGLRLTAFLPPLAAF